MPRPRKDGMPARPANRRKLTDRFVRLIVPEVGRVIYSWDTKQPGLYVATHETGRQSWRVSYRRNGRPDGFKLGDARSITLGDARRLAARVALDIAEGRDPKADRRAERAAGTFAELAKRYVNEWSRKRNKSWRQSDAIARRVLLPRWGKLKARSITRSDVRALLARIESPSAADAALATASAIFTFGVNMEVISFNPCSGIARNPRRSRERVLSDAEIKSLWPDLDVAHRLILFLGARPGEVHAMRAEDVREGFWHLPGRPIGTWCGTKNGVDHRLPLTDQVQAMIDDHLARPLPRRGCEERLSKLWRRRGIEKVTPHDLRRTFGTTVARLGFGRQAVSRLLNHADRTVTATYDRYNFEREDKVIVDAVARHVGAVTGTVTEATVVRLR